MKHLIIKYKNNEISLRSLISQIKNNQNYIDEVNKQTSFLDRYNADILERLYCILNDIDYIVKCKYCESKAKWSGRINDGYKLTCCSKECESKRISEQKTGTNKISSNRENKFIEWQNSITEVNDEVIKEIKYEKYISLITNSLLLDYLKNRYDDSYSLVETYQRIKLNIKHKPACPVCDKPVVFVGKKNKMFTTYCCNECAGKSEETIKKKKQTQLENWGTENCYDSEKYKQQVKEKYGVEYISQREDIIEKRKDTLLSKYGTTSLYTIPEIKDKIIQSNINHFGYDSIFKHPDTKKKAYEVLKLNGKLGTSKMEDVVYNYLIELGYNVERVYRSDIFPYNVDFYIKDYDLYIEFQGSQYHHGRAYLGTKDDLKEVELLKENDIERKNITNKGTQYAAMIRVWTKYDVEKRNTALNNHINFLEIYSCVSKDHLKQQIDLWYNCKHNNDFKYGLYNYLESSLNEEFTKCKELNITDDKFGNISKLGVNVIKYFQENLFYAKEKEIYANDPIKRRKLIQNRIKYLNKSEDELTVNDIITGFKKSGIYYGYSHFNPEWTNWFVNKFNIKTIYDPCGGWGHHLLGMLSCEKIIYNDINNETCNNVISMKDYFNIDNLEIHCGDGTEYIPENVDAFFMCPPYYNVEKYGKEHIFKNIDEYKEFLNKIFDIWNFCNKAKVFGLIIREDFIDLINYPYYEKYEIKMGNTHLGKKKYKEYFYVFKK